MDAHFLITYPRYLGYNLYNGAIRAPLSIDAYYC